LFLSPTAELIKISVCGCPQYLSDGHTNRLSIM
jgi:hypothetical protein